MEEDRNDFEGQGDRLTLKSKDGRSVLVEHPDGSVEINKDLGNLGQPKDAGGRGSIFRVTEEEDEDGKTKRVITKVGRDQKRGESTE